MRFSSIAFITAFLALTGTAAAAMELDCTLSGPTGVMPNSARFTVNEASQAATMTANGTTLRGAVQTDGKRFIKLAFGPVARRDKSGDHAVTMQLVYIKGTQQASMFAQVDGGASVKAGGYCIGA